MLVAVAGLLEVEGGRVELGRGAGAQSLQPFCALRMAGIGQDLQRLIPDPATVLGLARRPPTLKEIGCDLQRWPYIRLDRRRIPSVGPSRRSLAATDGQEPLLSEPRVMLAVPVMERMGKDQLMGSSEPEHHELWTVAKLTAAVEPLEDLPDWLADQASERFAPDTPAGRLAAQIAVELAELVIEHVHPAMILLRAAIREMEVQAQRDRDAEPGRQEQCDYQVWAKRPPQGHAEREREWEPEAGG